MTDLFSSINLGDLSLSNRLVRSATAERMADENGRPRGALTDLYTGLVAGGVGLIITGHMYIDPSGKCHPEMTGIHTDALIPPLTALANAVHRSGGRVAVQINHGGMQCSPEAVAEAVAPSHIEADFLTQPARAMRADEIKATIEAYANAARRAKLAGFDAVQLHGAHGYLISQFLSPFTNRRNDGWGGDLEGRMRFLREVCGAVREAVGPAFPLFIKLGMFDGVDGGLALEDGVQVVAALEGMGLDGVEVSGGIDATSSRTGIRSPEEEAYFRPLAQAAQTATQLPVMLVGGLRSRAVMEEVLTSGDAQLISLCRPLICEPDLPLRLQAGQARAACISANRCWPREPGEGIACHCDVRVEPLGTY